MLEDTVWEDIANEEQLSSSDDSEYSEARPKSRRKRRKVNSSGRARHSGMIAKNEANAKNLSLDVIPAGSLLNPLIELLPTSPSEELYSFEEFIEPLLPELVDASAMAQVERLAHDEIGQEVVPMSRLQAKLMLDLIPLSDGTTFAQAILRRRLSAQRRNLRALILGAKQDLLSTFDRPLTPLSISRATQPNPEVLDGLYSILSTPYDNSFASRIQGIQPQNISCLSVDWEHRTPWMDLMQDIREHFALMYSDREQPVEVEAAIEYVSLQAMHLPQVHEILRRAFWDGIDVSDSLQFSPERCTVIAMYKKMVVGVALLSSPVETYITYLAVKPGWDNAQIATSMLYHLITINPRKDITLHVSINNPAVLLYNRFGFKAEEFIVDFYADYLDSQSKASKNAFRLRLRG